MFSQKLKMHWGFISDLGVLAYLFRILKLKFYNKFLNKDLTYEIGSIRFVLPNNHPFGNEIYLYGTESDWGSEKVLADYLKEKRGTFLDIGANIGYYSVMMSDYADTVYAFEPDPRNIPWLKKNISSLKNVFHCNSAISNNSGKVDFVLGSLTTSRLDFEANNETGEKISVDAISIDDFADSHPNVRATAIKVDIEGADMLALLGADKLVRRQRPVFLIEFNRSRFNKFNLLKQFIVDHKYKLVGFVKEGKVKEFVTISKDNIRKAKMIFVIPEEITLSKASI